MGTSCTIVLSLEQNPESMGQESAESLLFASAFQITVSQKASGVRAERAEETSITSVHWAYLSPVRL